MTARPRVMALRALYLGDLLTAVPALRALRRALPDHELLLAAPSALAPLVELVDAVDTQVPAGELAPVPWTGPAPEVAVDLHGNGPASAGILAALRPGRLVAYAADDGPVWDPEEHERERWCRLVRHAFGVEADAGDLLLPPPPEGSPAPGAVVVHPGAASGSRRWPPERFAAVAAELAARGLTVLVTGSPAERGLCCEVARCAGLPETAVLAGSLGLRQLVALVAGARLLVCGDTGPAHVASAVGTPSVLLFGPTPPHRWGPPADGPHTVLHRAAPGEVGDPHGRTPDPALLRIGAPEVLAACELRLGSATPSGPAPAPSTPRSG